MKQEELAEINNFFLLSELSDLKTNKVCSTIIDSQTDIAYMDLTGRSLCKSSRSNKYIVVDYHYDVNYIRAIPIKNRKGPTITEA